MKIIRYENGRGEIGYASGGKAVTGDLGRGFTLTDQAADVRKVLAPVCPVSILCIGLNYRQHATETGASFPEHPVLFFKGTNAVLAPGGAIELPRGLRSDEVDYECELAVVIGRRCKNVRRGEALQHVAGYTCANDVTARDWQKRKGGSQWCRGKTFDTFCPLGPCLVTADEIPDPNRLRLRTLLNGEAMQDSTTADMIFDVPALIEFLSGSNTLEPGTVILTGTPSGVGAARQPPRWLRAGDEVTVEVEGIGQLTNPVREEVLKTPPVSP